MDWYMDWCMSDPNLDFVRVHDARIPISEKALRIPERVRDVSYGVEYAIRGFNRDPYHVSTPRRQKGIPPRPKSTGDHRTDHKNHMKWFMDNDAAMVKVPVHKRRLKDKILNARRYMNYANRHSKNKLDGRYLRRTGEDDIADSYGQHAVNLTQSLEESSKAYDYKTPAERDALLNRHGRIQRLRRKKAGNRVGWKDAAIGGGAGYLGAQYFGGEDR